jgi:hypothetical protein
MAVNHQKSLALSIDYCNFNWYVSIENNANHFTKFCLLKDSGLLGHNAVTGQVFRRTAVPSFWGQAVHEQWKLSAQ